MAGSRRTQARWITVAGVVVTALTLGLVAVAQGRGTPPASLAGGDGEVAADDDALAYAVESIADVPMVVQVAQRPTTTDVYAVDLSGPVYLLPGIAVPDASGEVSQTQVLDLSDRVAVELGGLLGLTFSPDGRVLYLDYVDLSTTDLVVEAFDVAEDGSVAPAPQETLRVSRQDGPENDHSGGALAFGPDGYLYVSVSDDLDAGAPQSLDAIKGKVLRIDPNRTAEGGAAAGYAVPQDNPFVGRGLEEIWAFGLKSPFRFSFDQETGDLWLTDVGVGRLEEVNKISQQDLGVNLGWPHFEGSQLNNEDLALNPLSPPRDPTYEYNHEAGRCAISGGVLYRGERFPDLQGSYLFTDFCATAVFGLATNDAGGLDESTLAAVPETSLTAVDADDAGNVYVSSINGGLYRMVDAPADGG